MLSRSSGGIYIPTIHKNVASERGTKEGKSSNSRPREDYLGRAKRRGRERVSYGLAAYSYAFLIPTCPLSLSLPPPPSLLLLWSESKRDFVAHASEFRLSPPRALGPNLAIRRARARCRQNCHPAERGLCLVAKLSQLYGLFRKLSRPRNFVLSLSSCRIISLLFPICTLYFI